MGSLFSNPAELFRSAVEAAVAPADSAALQLEVLSLFDQLYPPLLRYAVSFGLSRHDGEDVLQEVFLALFRHLQARKSRENLPGWAYRTTHNLALKRKSRVHAELRASVDVDDPADTGLEDGQPGPEEQVLFRERQARLQSVVRALPETDQMCLRLRADGLRYREIASTVGISLGGVAASLARSFERLQRADAR